ncbi:hypothetical protein RB5068 [Rhodopirellula baltica SH 1]|uniref:Uncharacterized protein n=1 Tax=Rhodopirellula baltica (strain DSM 10527 / NCIMB 13988 / SH1) TaxID=243090 RepID=Q7UGR1_RHOBA|nr:hypothetical protein RB5068 [Rhodopirellula baltica SH 1]
MFQSIGWMPGTTWPTRLVSSWLDSAEFRCFSWNATEFLANPATVRDGFQWTST